MDYNIGSYLVKVITPSGILSDNWNLFLAGITKLSHSKDPLAHVHLRHGPRSQAVHSTFGMIPPENARTLEERARGPFTWGPKEIHPLPTQVHEMTDAERMHPSVHTAPMYPFEEKTLYSKAQSTTFVDVSANIHPRLFPNHAEFAFRVGVIVPAHSLYALPNRFLVHDIGTYTRPYDDPVFASQHAVQIGSYDAFKALPNIKGSNSIKITEVLARLRWHAPESDLNLKPGILISYTKFSEQPDVFNQRFFYKTVLLGIMRAYDLKLALLRKFGLAEPINLVVYNYAPSQDEQVFSRTFQLTEETVPELLIQEIFNIYYPEVRPFSSPSQDGFLQHAFVNPQISDLEKIPVYNMTTLLTIIRLQSFIYANITGHLDNASMLSKVRKLYGVLSNLKIYVNAKFPPWMGTLGTILSEWVKNGGYIETFHAIVFLRSNFARLFEDDEALKTLVERFPANDSDNFEMSFFQILYWDTLKNFEHLSAVDPRYIPTTHPLQNKVLMERLCYAALYGDLPTVQMITEVSSFNINEIEDYETGGSIFSKILHYAHNSAINFGNYFRLQASIFQYLFQKYPNEFNSKQLSYALEQYLKLTLIITLRVPRYFEDVLYEMLNYFLGHMQDNPRYERWMVVDCTSDFKDILGRILFSTINYYLPSPLTTACIKSTLKIKSILNFSYSKLELDGLEFMWGHNRTQDNTQCQFSNCSHSQLRMGMRHHCRACGECFCNSHIRKLPWPFEAPAAEKKSMYICRSCQPT